MNGISMLCTRLFMLFLITILSVSGAMGGPMKTTKVVSEKEKQELALGQKELEKMKKSSPEAFRFAIMRVQMILGRLGYGTGPFNGSLDYRTRKALQEYQKYNNLPVSGEFDFQTFKKITDDEEILEQKTIGGLPLFIFTAELWNSRVEAFGTWVIDNGKAAFPFQTTRIVCYRDLGICFVATAQIAIGNILYLDTDLYEVGRWDAHEIETKPRDGICSRFIIRINRVQKSVTGIRSNIRQGGLCAKETYKKIHTRLEDGWKVYNGLMKAYNHSISRLFRKIE